MRLIDGREKNVSDCDAVYHERDACVALAAILAQFLGLRTWVGQHEPKDDPEWEPEWRNVVFIELPDGQVSWHIHERELPWFAGLPRGTLPWDGHTTDEKYARIYEYVRMNAPEEGRKREEAAASVCEWCGGTGCAACS